MKSTKLNKSFSMLIALGLTLGLANCSSDDDDALAAASCGSELEGTITSDCTIAEDEQVILKGAVTIADGATLTVEPGVTVLGDTSVDTVLIIDRGGKIEAVGTAAKPIVFTSANDEGNRATGDWGGIVINGYSHYNKSAEGVGEGEGDSGEFGGGTNPDTADDSGTLEYVRVEFAGNLFSTENELNGIAFQAVGSGTTVNYLQVHRGQDDGVEFFGGSVNVSNLVISNAGDDSFDWTNGWNGSASNVVIVYLEGTSEDPRAIEGDNDKNDNNATPRSNPSLDNFTIVSDNTDYKDLMKIRRGSYATLENFYIANSCGNKIKLDNNATIDQAGTDVVMNNSLLEAVAADCSGSAVTDATAIMGGEDDNEASADTSAFIGTNVTAEATMDYLTADLNDPKLVTSFLPATEIDGSGGTCIGAVCGTDWTADWTSFPEN